MATQMKRVLKSSVSIVNILKESQVGRNISYFPTPYPTPGHSHVGIDVPNKY